MNIKGLIIRETDFGEYDRYLTVLTQWNTKISILCKGVRRRKNPFGAAVRLFCYGDFTVLEKRGKYTLQEAESLDSFWEITGDVEAYALCCYFSQLIETGLTECLPAEWEEERPPFLRLFLCALYALLRQKRRPALVKAALEMRFLEMSGYGADVSGCRACGGELLYFSVENGNGLCAHCGPAPGYQRISRGTAQALQHMLTADLKRLFAYQVGAETEKELAQLCQRYVLYHCDRGFDTLDFYRSLHL